VSASLSAAGGTMTAAEWEKVRAWLEEHPRRCGCSNVATRTVNASFVVAPNVSVSGPERGVALSSGMPFVVVTCDVCARVELFSALRVLKEVG
jgi:hypothetical protein